MCLDPGETTGVATFVVDDTDVHIEQVGQIKTWPLEEGVGNLTTYFNAHPPTIVVHESYQVYAWKKDEHTFSDVPTIQVIGAIKALLIQRTVPYVAQTAQIAKAFTTDDKLRSWDMWYEGLRHGRDAIRHGVYFLMFGPPKAK